MMVWINGKMLAYIIEKGPSILSAREIKFSLLQGENRLLYGYSDFCNWLQ